MKRYLAFITIAFALSFVQGLSAQNLKSTDVPRILSYQGHITNADGVVTGVHPVTVRLYSDPDGKNKLWEDTYTTDVKDGIFNVQLGTRNPLPESRSLDRPVWLGVSIEGTAELRPLTQFTAAPYALNVPDKSITKEKLSEDLQTLMTKPIRGQEKQTAGDWSLTGNSGLSPGTDFLGTTDNVALEIHVDNAGSSSQGRQRVMRYEPNNVSPVIIGGFNGNSISSGVVGGVIAGGGQNADVNTIMSDFGTISGGEDNTIFENSEHATIAGGHTNTIGDSNGTSSDKSVISGGCYNDVVGIGSVISGGDWHDINSSYSHIGGGAYNKIYDDEGDYTVIGGGNYNQTEANYSVIGGGSTNKIKSTVTANDTVSKYSTVSGGLQNEMTGYANTIGGGDHNKIEYYESEATNSVLHSFIGGGLNNFIATNKSVIGGGEENKVLLTNIDGDQSHHAIIGGGRQNLIDTVWTLPKFIDT